MGICVKNAECEVLTQNPQCLEVCGDRQNTVCKSGCMRLYGSANGNAVRREGAELFPAVPLKGGSLFDIVVLNGGTKLMTILFPLKEKHERTLKALGTYRLSKREMELVRLVVQGKSNTEIGKMLSISRATVRTHLNNIYKKLPNDVLQELRQAIAKRMPMTGAPMVINSAHLS